MLQKSVDATINNFLRAGIWIFAFIGLYFIKTKVTLNDLYFAWIVGEVLSLIYSVYCLRNLNWKVVLVHKIDWKWIFRGIKVSYIFFISGIALKMFEYSERFFIQKMINEKIAGIYFFFYNIAYLPYTFFASVMVINFLPSMIKHYINDEFEEYNIIKKNFIYSTYCFVLGFYTVTVIFFYIIMKFLINNQEYENLNQVFFWLLLSSMTSIFSDIFYLQLYILKMDRFILFSLLIASSVHIVLNYFLINIFGIYGVLASKVIVTIVLFLARWIMLSNLKHG